MSTDIKTSIVSQVIDYPDKITVQAHKDLAFPYFMGMYGLEALGYKVERMILLGGRFTYKTKSTTHKMMYDPKRGMLANPKSNAMVVMNTLKDHSKKTFRELEWRITNDIERKWPNSKWQWDNNQGGRMVNSNNEKAMVRTFNGYKQEISFDFVKNLASAGGVSIISPNGEQGQQLIQWYEEIIPSSAKFQTDFTKEIEELDNINTYEDTIIREFGDDDYNTGIFTFNSWNALFPLVAEAKSVLEEKYGYEIDMYSEEFINQMEGVGYMWAFDEETNTFYCWTGIGVSRNKNEELIAEGKEPYLSKKVYDKVAKLKEKNYEEYAVRYAGAPAVLENSPYSKVLPQTENIDIEDITNFRVGLDQTGGTSETYMVLGGYDKNKNLVYKDLHRLSPHSKKERKKLISEVFDTLDKWDKKYRLSSIVKKLGVRMPIHIDPSNPTLYNEFKGALRALHIVKGKSDDHYKSWVKIGKLPQDITSEKTKKEGKLTKWNQDKGVIIYLFRTLMVYEKVRIDHNCKELITAFQQVKLIDEKSIEPFALEDLYDAGIYTFITDVLRMRKKIENELFSSVEEIEDYE